MEKYSRYRDQGSGIAPFFPVPSQPSGIYLPLHILLFAIRLPILIAVALSYFFIFSWLPIGSLARKAILWALLGVPGIWWVDLQIDGVKRGTLSKARAHLPQPGSIIVSSSTSPLDALYLAAVFDPLFTRCYPASRLVQPVSLFSAIVGALAPSSLLLAPATSTDTPTLTTLPALLARHPDRITVLTPECTTTNGRAILPLSPALASAPASSNIFPTSLRYSPADVTTPVPGWRAAARFLWVLCSAPSHTVRVRIAEPLRNTAASESSPSTTASSSRPVPADSFASNFFDKLDATPATADDIAARQRTNRDARPDGSEAGDGVNPDERRLLDHVAEALARLGRVKRVALGVRDKGEFVRLWRKRGHA